MDQELLSEGGQRRFLNERAAATYIGLSAKTLQRMRSAGDGIPFIKAGARVLYDMNDLAAFMAARKVSSTSAYVGR